MKSEIDLSMRFIVFFFLSQNSKFFWKQHWSDVTHNKPKKKLQEQWNRRYGSKIIKFVNLFQL